MKLGEIQEALRNATLDHLADDVEQLTLPAIRIECSFVTDEDIPIGASKLGGRPDLPQAESWPQREGKPLTFLAQFNLTEISPFDVNGELPSSGMLSFFYDFEGNPWGIQPQDRNGWQVVYFDGDVTRLSRRAWPLTLPAYFRLSPREPWFSTMTTLSDEPEWVAGIPLSDIERLQLAQVIETLLLPQSEKCFTSDDMHARIATRHQLLGYPWLGLRRRMPEACELAANRHLDNSAVILESSGMLPAARRGEILTNFELEQAYERWRLLFQLGNISGLPFPEDYDNEDDPYWKLDLWARGGLMYFWIERDRLAQRDFSNAWLIGASQL